MCGCTCSPVLVGGAALAAHGFAPGLRQPVPARAPESTPPATTPRPPATRGGGAAGQARDGVLLIGDSLTVGVRPYFNEQLTGMPTTVDATGGIPLAEGMRRYDAVADKPRVVEMALFTNNSPGQADELRAAIEKTVADARGRGGRVVWATIVRPGNYGPVNAMIRELAAKHSDVMGLVDWARMVEQDPGLVGRDGVHSSPAGYEVRAKAFADAARA